MLSKHRNLDLILSANICHYLREASHLRNEDSNGYFTKFIKTEIRPVKILKGL